MVFSAICLNCSENFESVLFIDSSNNWKMSKGDGGLGTWDNELLSPIFGSFISHFSSLHKTDHAIFNYTGEIWPILFFAILQRKKVELWHAATSCKVVKANTLCKDFDWY